MDAKLKASIFVPGRDSIKIKPAFSLNVQLPFSLALGVDPIMVVPEIPTCGVPDRVNPGTETV
jgi:hypothetical protein